LLYEASLAYFAESRERFSQLAANPAAVDDILDQGAQKARKKGREVLNRVRAATGIDTTASRK